MRPWDSRRYVWSSNETAREKHPDKAREPDTVQTITLDLDSPVSTRAAKNTTARTRSYRLGLQFRVDEDEDPSLEGTPPST